MVKRKKIAKEEDSEELLVEKKESTASNSQRTKIKKTELDATNSELKNKASRSKRATTDAEKGGMEEPTKEKPASKGSQKVSTKEKVQELKIETKKTAEGSKKGEDKKDVVIKMAKEGDTKPRKGKKKKDVKDDPVPQPLKYESLGEGPPPIPPTNKKYMGCHVSGAGGVWNAFENAEECSAKSFALFLRSQRQWAAKPLSDDVVEKWQEVSKDYMDHLVLPHGSYLMNLGSPNVETRNKSRNLLVEELMRCQRLGIPHYNFHPGSSLGEISRVQCCELIAEGINYGHSQTDGVICVLENMCCQGFTVGGDLHELRLIIEQVKDKTRVGVCLDTCHAHAAGYDLGTEEGFQSLIEDFEKIIGWQFLRGLHINDSKGKAGDHLDRHENIGRGTIGIEGFRRIMNCSHFDDIPLVLETPWTSNEGYAKEIKKLEALIKK